MEPNTPTGAGAPLPQPLPGSLSAPVIISDLDSRPAHRRTRRFQSVQIHPAGESIAPAPQSENLDRDRTVGGRKRPNVLDLDEASRLKVTRRQQRERYFDTLAKEADAMGNLPLSPRRICTEDDLEKLELKRCFELLHAMGRASDPNATIEATRASIGGFLQAIFHGWDTSIEIPRVPEIVGVEVNAPAGRICDCPLEHADVKDCIRSNTCRTQIRVCAVYDNQSITFTYYSKDLGDVKDQILSHGQPSNMNEADVQKEARYQRWLNGSDSVRPHGQEDPGNVGSQLSSDNFIDAAEDRHSRANTDEGVDHDPYFPVGPEALVPKDNQPMNPLTYPNLQIRSEWREVLKTRLHKALLKRMHEQNKYRALWIVRHMVLDWEKGTGMKAEEDMVGDTWGFVRAESIQQMVLALV